MADITIKGFAYDSQRIIKLERASREYMGGYDCKYCNHSLNLHAGETEQPYFYLAPWEGDTKHHKIVNGETLKAKKVVLQDKEELTRLVCRECAWEMDTRQVVCYQRSIGVGEVFDTRTNQVIEPDTQTD